MFGRRLQLFTAFGIPIFVDVSWVFLALIVTWSLATRSFPASYPGWPSFVYLWMGVLGALGLFASILLHELGHSVVAKYHGVAMRGITLFIFGGVAEMTEEPPSPKAEFQVAIAGPLVSIALALGFYWGSLAGADLGVPVAAAAVAQYLALINGVLVVFNMIPAFPLDGGRVLRALLWGRSKNLESATRTTSRIGVGFSFVLIGLGVLSALTGNIVSGLWSFLIGMFLRNAAQMSYRQVLLRRTLEGEPLSRFMHPDPAMVPGHMTLQDLAERHLYRDHHKLFPVVEGDRLVGAVSIQEIAEVPRTEWPTRTVREIAQPVSDDNSIDLGLDALAALSRMNRGRLSSLLVLDRGHVVGIVTLKDLMQYLSIQIELNGKK